MEFHRNRQQEDQLLIEESWKLNHFFFGQQI
jgi:hypothetical protein